MLGCLRGYLTAPGHHGCPAMLHMAYGIIRGITRKKRVGSQKWLAPVNSRNRLIHRVTNQSINGGCKAAISMSQMTPPPPPHLPVQCAAVRGTLVCICTFLQGSCRKAGSACVQRRDVEKLLVSVILDNRTQGQAISLTMHDGSCTMGHAPMHDGSCSPACAAMTCKGHQSNLAACIMGSRARCVTISWHVLLHNSLTSPFHRGQAT